MPDGHGYDFDALRTAFDRREFFLLYQPIVSLADGRCLGAEALIRWKQRDGTAMDAGRFMPSTERTPLSGLITYWVIDTVAADLSDWLGAHPAASIAINVPPEILGRGGLEYAATKSGLRQYAKQLILEITEHGIPDQLGLDALNRIPQSGARVALDDTTLSGTNLALLTRCHFDFVKVDRKLVDQIDANVVRPSWLDGLSALLGNTPLQVIAEGIESAAQHDILARAGVQWGQGRYLAAPQSADAFMRYYDTAPVRR